MTQDDKAWMAIGAIEEILRLRDRRLIGVNEALDLIKARVSAASKELDDAN